MPDHKSSRHAVHRRPPEALRTHTLRLAVTTRELDTIRERAARAGQRLGPHLRSCALIGSADSASLIDALVRQRAEMRGALGNLNQASHRANLLIAAARDGAAGLDLAGLLVLLCQKQACSLTAFVGDPAPSFFGPNPSCVC
jgi:hypothetical protein